MFRSSPLYPWLTFDNETHELFGSYPSPGAAFLDVRDLVDVGGRFLLGHKGRTTADRYRVGEAWVESTRERITLEGDYFGTPQVGRRRGLTRALG
jgi:hypothetical protein